jgi:CBS domain-containing protein
MRVQDLMATKPWLCSKDDSLECAAQKMWDHDVGCVVVVDDGGRAIAMLTDRDACMAAYTQGRALRDIRVSTAMSNGLCACRPGDSILDVWSLMRGGKVRRLPVLDESGIPVGVISINDIARAQGGGKHKRGKDVSPEDVARTLGEITAPRGAPVDVVSS